MNNDVDLGESDREIAAAGFAKLLAETFMLYAKARGYLGKIECPLFQTDHLLTAEQYREPWAALDEIAERMRAFGAYASSAPPTSLPFRSRSGQDRPEPRTMRCIRPSSRTSATTRPRACSTTG